MLSNACYIFEPQDSSDFKALSSAEPYIEAQVWSDYSVFTVQNIRVSLGYLTASTWQGILAGLGISPTP